MMGGHLDQQYSHNQYHATRCVEFSQSVETAPPSSPLIHKIGKGVSLLRSRWRLADVCASHL